MRLIEAAPDWAKQIHSHIGIELPVDPEAVCRYLSVEYRRRVMHPCIDGLYYRTSSGVPYIYINSRFRLIGRQRFTAAHEIGHHLITLATRKETCRFLDCSQTAFSPVEAAANLLMPENLVREFWEDLSSNRRYRMQIMADRFEVTRSAIRIRAEELQLLPQPSPSKTTREIPRWHTF